MYLFFWITISLLVLLIIVSFGFFFLNNNFFLKKNNRNILHISSILGFSLIIFFSHILYFFLNLSVNSILFLIIVLFLISLAINFFKSKKLFLNIAYKTYLLTIPIVFFFILLAEFYGEQFYVFRGNYWDYFYYIKQAINLSSNNFSDFRNLGDFQYLVPEKKMIFKPGYSYALNDIFSIHRPAVSLLLAIFLKIKFLSLFQITYGYTIILLSLVSVSSYFFILNNFNKSNFFLPIIFSFSFWVLYIFEISALAHLCSLSIIILTISFSIDIVNELKKKNYGFFFLFSFFSTVIFLVYPEIFFLYLCFIAILLFLLLFKYKKIFIEKRDVIFFSVLCFFLLSLVGIETSYKLLLHLKKVSSSIYEVDFWGYYGAFILGKNNLILDPGFVNFFKTNYSSSSILIMLKQLLISHIKEEYYLIFLNIIPSIFGLYYLTAGKINIILLPFIFIALIVLNFFLLKNFLRNLLFLFRNRLSNFSLVLISLFLTVIFVGFFLLFNKAIWGLIKLYFYFFPLYFILVFFLFKKKKNKFYLEPNKILLFLLIIFPIYKYGVFNYGIGSKDSFPSILNADQKEKHIWRIDRKKLNACNNVFIDIVINKYNFPKIYYLKLTMDYDNINYLYLENFKSGYDCTVSVKDNLFKLENNKL